MAALVIGGLCLAVMACVAGYAVVASLTESGIAANWPPSVRTVLLPAVMLVVLAAETGAVLTVRRGVAG